MPELPEVETMRRGILGVVGSRIEDVASVSRGLKPISIQPRLTTLRRRVQGREISAVDRVGKRVVLRLDRHDSLIFEPRMTGLVLLADPPDEEHLRFRVDLAGGPIRRVWFWDRRGLGSVRLLSPAEFEEQLGADKLGPDALSLTPSLLLEQLADSRREIKVALLDQRAIAGIGNLYAAEILNVAGVHPLRRCDRLELAEWSRIQAATLLVLNEAIRHEGSTLSDGTYRTALNQAGGYQNQHRVYGRAGETCRACRQGTVQRIVQAQRSTFFCPVCQPRASRK